MGDLWKIEDLKSFLYENLRFRVSLEDLKNPSPDLIKRIYYAFFHEFGFTTENLNQLPLSTIVDLGIEQDLYSEVLPFAILTIMLKNILKSISCNFTVVLDDTLNPKIRKLKNVTYHLFQYYNFWNDSMQFYLPIHKEYNERKLELQSFADTIENLRQEINKETGIISELKQNSYIKNREEISEQFTKVTRTSEKYSAEKQSLRAEVEKLNINLSMLHKERGSLPSLIDSLKKNIVPTVDEIRNHIQGIEYKISEFSVGCNPILMKVKELDSKIKTEESVEKVKVGIQIFENDVCHESAEKEQKLKVFQHVKESIECKKKAITAKEKSKINNGEMLHMLKQQNAKQMWRLQQQMEEQESQLKKAKDGISSDQILEQRALTDRKNNLISQREHVMHLMEICESEFQCAVNLMASALEENHNRIRDETQAINKRLQMY